MIGAVALAAAVVVPCARNAVAWIGRPFAGVLFADNLIVVSIGRASWREPQLRRAEWARIVAIDGTPVETAAAAHAAIERRGIGGEVTFTLRRGAELFRVRLPVVAFARRDFDEVFAPMLVMGVALMVMGTLLAWLRPALPEVRGLFAVCASLGLMLVTGPDQYGPYRFTPLYLLAFASVPPAVFHLAATYPWRPGRWAGRAVVAAYALFAVIGALLIALRFDPQVFLLLLYLVYFALANALLLYMGSLVGAFAVRRRPRAEISLALAAVLASSGTGVVAMVTYPLLTEPISAIWLIAPIALLPILSGIAFVGLPSRAPRPGAAGETP
ncbi:MAG TPA: hypothetical protein VFD92_11120 [Candidatus Binatia bacterium]|nr:hypothetical protein [Candidatus Binatia bacterium]